MSQKTKKLSRWELRAERMLRRYSVIACIAHTLIKTKATLIISNESPEDAKVFFRAVKAEMKRRLDKRPL